VGCSHDGEPKVDNLTVHRHRKLKKQVSLIAALIISYVMLRYLLRIRKNRSQTKDGSCRI